MAFRGPLTSSKGNLCGTSFKSGRPGESLIPETRGYWAGHSRHYPILSTCERDDKNYGSFKLDLLALTTAISDNCKDYWWDLQYLQIMTMFCIKLRRMDLLLCLCGSQQGPNSCYHYQVIMAACNPASWMRWVYPLRWRSQMYAAPYRPRGRRRI